MSRRVFHTKKRWGVILAAALLCSAILAACGENSPSTLNAAGPVASSEAGLFWFILIVATIVFVAVEGALIYSIVRYRERPNTPDPRQIHGNNKLEIAWTIIPAVILIAVLVGTIYTMFGLQQPAGRKLEVKAIGHQWWWEFQYPNQHIVTADSLYVPANTTIQVDLVSDNVIHSFWVPQLTGKTDVIPGHDNHQWFSADKVGTYRGECAEYCGTGHANMNFQVKVLPSSDTFNTWVSNQQQAATTTAHNAPAAQGAKIFASTCVGCHGIVGVNLTNNNDPKAAALVGPNLTHFGGRQLIAGGVLSTQANSWADDPSCKIVNGKVVHPDDCSLYQWLKDPQAVKPGNDMVVSLTSDQINALVAYLETLK